MQEIRQFEGTKGKHSWNFGMRQTLALGRAHRQDDALNEIG